MRQQVIYVLTHDSIFVGEDGPTHQPIEQLASLRAIPGVTVIRPADAAETAVAWAAALEKKDGPTVLALTRQNLPPCSSDPARAKGLRRGGYVLREQDEPDVVMIASGSEVCVAVGAAEILAGDGVRVRVVSMPSTQLFEAQDESYRDSVIPPHLSRRVVVEAGSSFGWHRYAGLEGLVIGIDRFGASAPYQELAEKFGFTAEAVAGRVREYLR